MLSLICQVKTYRIEPFLYAFRGKINLLDLADYLSFEDYVIIRSDAVRIWQNLLPNFPRQKWNVEIKELDLDFSKKAIQDLQIEIEKLLFLKHIMKFYQEKERVYIISSFKFKFLSKIDKFNPLAEIPGFQPRDECDAASGGNLTNWQQSYREYHYRDKKGAPDLKSGSSTNIFYYPDIECLSRINTCIDRVYFSMVNFGLLIRVILQFIAGLIYNKQIKHKIRYIYDDVSPRELSIDKNKITFSWIIDNKLVHKKEILFLLPEADFQMKAHAKEYTKDKELLAINRFTLLRLSSPKMLSSCFRYLMKIFMINVFLPKFDLEGLMCRQYVIRILKWIPFVESLRPGIYITNCSRVNEDPGIVYFNALGMKTVNWSYAGQNSFFSRYSKNCEFRFFDYANIISSTVIVWNQHCKKFIEDHPQFGSEIKVIGPLMCGDEKVLDLDRQSLCKKFELLFDNTSKYIVIFDSYPKVSDKFRKYYVCYPDNSMDEYNYLFLKDVNRLLSDFKDIILVYKPKRSLTSGKFSYSVKSRQLLNEMIKNSRVIILDHLINPWVPIAIADMCICLPFGSPAIAALHYEKLALFHDPMNIARYHKYQSASSLITNTYEELKSKVEYLLFENTSVSNLPQVKDLQGLYPGENSSNKFREYLKSLQN